MSSESAANRPRPDPERRRDRRWNDHRSRSLRDTVIGEGTKIDNQVQIGHNVTIGRHCLLAAQIGLAGSLTIGDNVALGAKVGINNHLRIGDGAQVTAMSGVKDDIPANGAGVDSLPSRPNSGSVKSLRWSV